MNSVIRLTEMRVLLSRLEFISLRYGQCGLDEEAIHNFIWWYIRSHHIALYRRQARSQHPWTDHHCPGRHRPLMINLMQTTSFSSPHEPGVACMTALLQTGLNLLIGRYHSWIETCLSGRTEQDINTSQSACQDGNLSSDLWTLVFGCQLWRVSVTSRATSATVEDEECRSMMLVIVKGAYYT